MMEKEWFDLTKNETRAKHKRYLRTYRNLIEETVLLLNGGQRDVLPQVDDMIEFESKFAKVFFSFFFFFFLAPTIIIF